MSVGESTTPLFTELEPREEAQSRFGTGVLPAQTLEDMIGKREILATEDIEPDQVQPASVDLRLGSTAYRLRGSFLPGLKHTVEERIERYGEHEIDLREGGLLERGCVYVVKLIEHLELRKDFSGLANPKSSTGRLDVFTRLITDRSTEFETVRAGYRGPLFAEISPRSFSVVVRRGSRLNQLRLRRGTPIPSAISHKRLHEEFGLVESEEGEAVVERGVALRVNLRGKIGSDLVGYKAKKHTGLIDVDKIGHYDPRDFWEPIHAEAGAAIILNPDDFYILASKETVKVPPTHAAEMVAYDTSIGEFRVHYAGFFDPGFGASEAGGQGSRAVLEVRSHEVPFVVEDGQVVGRLVYERMTDIPERLYGQGIGSSYQRQGLQLAKQFRKSG